MEEVGHSNGIKRSQLVQEQVDNDVLIILTHTHSRAPLSSDPPFLFAHADTTTVLGGVYKTQPFSAKNIHSQAVSLTS